MTCPADSPSTLTRSRFSARSLRIGAVSLILALCQGCDFLRELVSTPENSRSFYEGLILNARNGSPVAGAVIALGEETAESDTQGFFRFPNVPTGPATLRLTRSGFHSLDAQTTVFLPGRYPAGTPETFFLIPLNSLPQIRSFSAIPGTTKAVEDSVRFVLDCRDTTGEIRTITCDFGDGLSEFAQVQDSAMVLAFSHTYAVGGTYAAEVAVIDESGDTTIARTLVQISTNHRPQAVLQFPDHPFFTNRYDQIRIQPSDPDGNFDHLTIDWGDSVISYYRLPDSGWYAYKYMGVQAETSYTIIVTLTDLNQARAVYQQRVTVAPLIPPLMQHPLTVEPRTITSQDTSFVVTVIVFRAEGYVKELFWRLNVVDAQYAIWARDYLDSTTGVINGQYRLFTHTFPTADLKATNHISVKVIDAFNGESEASATFFKQ